VAIPGAEILPACEAMLTMWPLLRGIIRAIASWVPWMTPIRLISIWRRNESSGSSTNGVTGMIPALLISTSIGPSRRSASSRNPSKDPRSVTSSASATVPPPSPAAVCSASVRSTSPIATRAPRRTSASAVALPIPRAPPVIATTLPFKDRRCFAITPPPRPLGRCSG